MAVFLASGEGTYGDCRNMFTFADFVLLYCARTYATTDST